MSDATDSRFYRERAAAQNPLQERVVALEQLLRRARNLLSHPTAWAEENAASRWALSEEIARVLSE